MGLFSFLKRADINQGVEESKSVANALLLDVRTPAEYREGHIPGSKNIPLQTIEDIDSVAGSLDTPLYVYCHSGARSRQAAAMLQEMGYTRVRNIGGICAYSGSLEA